MGSFLLNESMMLVSFLIVTTDVLVNYYNAPVNLIKEEQMAIQTYTESIFLKETSMTEILLTYLSENIDYTNLIEEIIKEKPQEMEVLE